MAVRTGGVLNYLLSDQLGSTSVTLDVNGVNVGELRYSAFGETRKTFGSTPTDYRYTGQREDSYIKLLDYGSRYYDPGINQFSQPDTVIPDPYNSLDYQRYAYTRYNPIKYKDPSGHRSTGECGVNGELCSRKGDSSKWYNDKTYVPKSGLLEHLSKLISFEMVPNLHKTIVVITLKLTRINM